MTSSISPSSSNGSSLFGVFMRPPHRKGLRGKHEEGGRQRGRKLESWRIIKATRTSTGRTETLPRGVFAESAVSLANRAACLDAVWTLLIDELEKEHSVFGYSLD